MTHVAILLVPTLACLVISTASSGIQRRMNPAAGAIVLTAAAVAAAGAVLLALGAIGLAYLLQLPAVAGPLGWCRELSPINDQVPSTVGLLSLGLLAGAGWRGATHVRRSTWRSSVTPAELVVVRSSIVEAVAMPGNPNRIVVSSAMMDLLDDDERDAMLAHERAHLRHCHHRFLVVAGLAAAAVPLVAPIRARVRFCTERWADESAAAQTGDRSLVARAIAKAALAHSGPTLPSSALGLVGLGVPGRIQALLDPPKRTTAAVFPLYFAGFAGLATSIGASAILLHHTVALALHMCGVN